MKRYVFVDGYPERDDEAGEWVTHTDYAALQQQLAAAREALNALEADKARMDWLEENGCDEFMVQRFAPPDLLWYDSSTRAPVGADHFPTLRAAIDATLQRDRQP